MQKMESVRVAARRRPFYRHERFLGRLINTKLESLLLHSYSSVVG